MRDSSVEVNPAALPLGTRRARVESRFGPPLTRYDQPGTGQGILQCLIYATRQGEDAYARLCFDGERLALASVVLGAQALEPAETAPEGPIQTLEPGPPGKRGGSLGGG